MEVGGTWYPGSYSPDSQEKRKGVILHFHGGAYIIGDGRKEDLGFGAGLMTRNTEYWVLGLQYRVSSNPDCRFPAALQDAVTGYQFLLDKGFAANEIIVSGDSAGANLAIALLRYFEEFGSETGLPKPKAALLWCAWLNPGRSTQPHSCSSNPRYRTDYLCDAFPERGVETYAPPGSGIDATGPWVSPKNYPFECKGVPMWFQYGSLEISADDVQVFAYGMREEGNEVVVHEDEAPHDILMVGGRTGFEEKAEGMGRAMGRWVGGLA